MLYAEKKQFQVELSLRINLVQFSLKRPLFTQSRSSSESRRVPSSSSSSPRSFTLVTCRSSHLQSILCAVSIPVSGGPSSSEAFRNMFSCPFSFHQAEGQEDNNLCSLLHVRSSFLKDLLSWFTSLFLF